MRYLFITSLLMAACSDPPELDDDPLDATTFDAVPTRDAPAAAPCGELGQACCRDGEACHGNGAHMDIYCSTGSVCVAPVPDCGGEGQACCAPVCSPDGGCFTRPCDGNQECVEGTCEVFESPRGCGGDGEACCVYPDMTLRYCDLGFACDGEAADGTRTCL